MTTSIWPNACATAPRASSAVQFPSQQNRHGTECLRHLAWLTDPDVDHRSPNPDLCPTREGDADRRALIAVVGVLLPIAAVGEARPNPTSRLRLWHKMRRWPVLIGLAVPWAWSRASSTVRAPTNGIASSPAPAGPTKGCPCGRGGRGRRRRQPTQRAVALSHYLGQYSRPILLRTAVRRGAADRKQSAHQQPPM